MPVPDLQREGLIPEELSQGRTSQHAAVTAEELQLRRWLREGGAGAALRWSPLR